MRYRPLPKRNDRIARLNLSQRLGVVVVGAAAAVPTGGGIT